MRSDLIFTLAAMAALLAAGLYGYLGDEPFVLTLAAKAAIFGLAGAGLNVALGYGGLVSLGHAAFFGIGGYAAGILASHARNYEPMMTWPIELAGTTSAPVSTGTGKSSQWRRSKIWHRAMQEDTSLFPKLQ